MKINSTSKKKMKLFFPLLLLLLFSSLTNFAYAKTVVCIASGGEEGYLNIAEGYIRQELGNNPQYQKGGSLTDCLNQLENGDTLIIIAHGCEGGGAFTWDQQYNGFGNGINLMPIPAKFANIKNVSVEFIACWSGLDPDGNDPDLSIAQKLISTMGGEGNKITRSFNGMASPAINTSLSGGTEEQLDAADNALKQDESYVNNPPVGRPLSQGEINQQQAAQAIINKTPGTGSVTVGISYSLTEKMEDQRTRRSFSLQAPSTCSACGCCGYDITILSVELSNFKAVSESRKLHFMWETASETSNLGMNLWCAQIQGNQFNEITRLNSELIPSKAILPNYGAVYSSTDYPYVNTNLQPGVQHCTLEDIDASGQCTLHCDQIDTVVVGEGNSVSDPELNELRTKAIALCNEHKPEGVCLDQLLASHP